MDPGAPTITVTPFELAVALIMPLAVIGIIYYQRLKIGGKYLYALFRATIQLALIGYILKWIFDIQSELAVLAYLFALVGISSWIVLGQQRKAPKVFYPILGAAIFVGSVFSIVMVTQLILKIEPWYNPRYLIPIAGMIIGNAMKAAALSLERFRSDMKESRRKVETLISLGASKTQASRELINRALRAGLLPNIMSMMSVGLVHLPGMMTGQMIAGNVPTQVVRYQLLVTFMISAAIALTAVVTLRLSARKYFTTAHQLRLEMIE